MFTALTDPELMNLGLRLCHASQRLRRAGNQFRSGTGAPLTDWQRMADSAGQEIELLAGEILDQRACIDRHGREL